jgi:uncharacterized repeat protein (TIGR01451 family)
MIAACLPFALTLALSSASSQAATAGQTFSPLLCPAAGSTSNCNAQDVNTVSYSLNTELDTCTGPTDTGSSIINITYTQNARRYNITSINSVSGQAVAGGSQCGETFLSADQAAGTYTQTATIEYKCVDNSGNGTIDVAAVFNWNQTASVYVDPVVPTSTALITTPKCTSLGFVDIQGLSVPASLTLTKSAPTPTLKVGVESTYGLTVTNVGGSPINAEVKDQLPAGFINVSASGTGWSCSVDGSNLVTCSKNAVAASAVESIEVKATPTGIISGQSVTNYASAGPSGSAPPPGPDCTSSACGSNTSTVAAADFTISKSTPSPGLEVGVNSVYTLTVTTPGTNVAAEVKDLLPADLTYVSATGTDWSCAYDSGSRLVTCDKASISTGTPEAIAVTVTPTAASVGQSVTNYASAGPDGAAPAPGPSCTTANCGSDTSDVADATFTMDKSAPSPALKVGENSVYTLTVSTNGAGVAAEVKDLLPAGLTYVEATGTDWVCAFDSGSRLVTCDKASISTGTPEAISVTVTPTAASVGQSVTNYASAGLDGAAPTPGPSCTTADCGDNTSDVGDASFTLSKSDPSPALKVSQNSVYTLTVTTDGEGVAAEVKDLLPAGLNYVSATGSSWNCDYDSGSRLVTCDKASISTGTPEEVEITVTPDATVSGGSVTNYASAGLDGEAPPPGSGCTSEACDSNSSSVTPASFSVLKSAPSPGLKVGAQSTYTLTVETDGSNVPAEVKDQLPTGLSFVSATGSGWSCGEDAGLVTCEKTISTGGAAEEIEVTVLTESSALGQDVTNYASAGPEGEAPAPGPTCSGDGCDSSVAEVEPAGFTLVKSAPVPPLQVHQNSVYTLTVTTDGSDVDAEVKDQLPAGMTYVGATGTGWNCAVDANNLVTCSKAISSGASEQIAVTVTTEATLNAKNVTNYASAGSTGAVPSPANCTPAAGVACATNTSAVADIREEIKKAVEDDVQAYLGARLDQLIGSFDSQSRLQRFRNTACGVSRDLSLSGEGTSQEQNIAANGTFSMKGSIVPTADVPPEQCSNVNIWAQLDVGYVDGLEDSAATGGMATVGAEYLITDNFLAGARLSMDYTDASFDSEANSDISGYGWLAGPYISAEIANNLFLDGFIGYGTSWNDYDGNYEGLDLSGDFTSQRIAGYLNLSGTYQTGDVLLTPLVGVSYGREWSDSFSVSNDIVGDTDIDGQDAELGRLKGRIETGYLVSDYADERLELFLAPQVTYDFVRNAGPDGDQLLGDGLWRGGLEGGFRFSKDQFGASLIVGYDGVGVSDWNAYRGQLQLNYTW